MQFTTLGSTSLRVSVAGLGTGGFSRLGLKSGKTDDEAARLIHEARGLGINFIDTAPAYGTEGVVGRALKTIPRDSVVIATKAQIRGGATPAQVVGSRNPDDLAWAILDAYGDRDAIAKEQKRWVRTHASIENATLELERVYQRYLGTHALARAA